MSEPAVDLGILMAIASSQKDQPVSADTVVFGEVGLSGEIRSVAMAEQRVREAQKLGFRKVILPKANMRSLSRSREQFDVELMPVENIRQAISLIGH